MSDSPPYRAIVHLDLDAFFCSVEEQRDPTLRGKPFAVDGGRIVTFGGGLQSVRGPMPSGSR